MSASFWLDSSEDSISFAHSGILSSRSSTDSFNLDNIPHLDNYPSLLLPSHSLDSLPRCGLELIKVPPCPSTTPRRKRTQPVFLSLMATLALPKGNRPNRRHANVLVSSPTPERLKNVARLKPALQTWISAVPRSTPPDILPWSPPREKPAYVWVPEGSCFPPSYLRSCLRERHGPIDIDTHLLSASGEARRDVTLKPIEPPDSPSRSRPLRRCASHSTHARVADCTPSNIPMMFPPLHVRGKLRRWSLGVPPSYISTEFMKRRHESQRVDAVAGIESAQSDALNDAPPLPLPAIKVSTSTATIAISFPGSPEGPTHAPEPLAIRRGQKMLASLTLRSPRHATEEYPSIPTAFLGTPSAYSPHFRLTSSNAQCDAESLPISDMISTLRSQAASLKVSSPAESSSFLSERPPSVNSLSAASSDIVPSVSEDDWAFAHDLMSRYGEHAQDRTPRKEKYRKKQASSIRKSLTSNIGSAIQTSQVRRASVPPAASPLNNRAKSSSAPRTDLVTPRHNTRAARDLRRTTPNIGTTRYVPHLHSNPRLPEPLRPHSPITPHHAGALALDSPKYPKVESSIQRPPGILKHAKSVRFADMPRPNDAKGSVLSASQLHTSTPKGTGGFPSPQPSPLRACFVAEDSEVRTPSGLPYPAPDSEENPPIFTVNQRDSVQQTPSQTLNLRGSMFNSPTHSVTPGLFGNSLLSSGNSRVEKTLSPNVRERDRDKEKENSPLASRMQRRSRRHTEVVDENTASRTLGGEGASGGRKHRLSSPLKSFFGRLRA
ncbi:hypothetical protein F5148DRAFT_1178968 [Russula earlei]|uniref:Uncharacterized protein n=1 Tax=Russula earlei TaxID=71964 RepID=A0ACC0UFW0_9AGAM|nr:hypothetical protein F5148DRAFT_1178968 [Russula earlei]